MDERNLFPGCADPRFLIDQPDIVHVHFFERVRNILDFNTNMVNTLSSFPDKRMDRTLFIQSF